MSVERPGAPRQLTVRVTDADRETYVGIARRRHVKQNALMKALIRWLETQDAKSSPLFLKLVREAQRIEYEER